MAKITIHFMKGIIMNQYQLKTVSHEIHLILRSWNLFGRRFV